MHFHIHTARSYSRVVLSLGPAVALFLLVLEPAPRKFEGASVTGRVTYEGRPVSGMMICFSSADKPHASYDMLAPDGSFQLQTNRPGDGAAPGNYRVHFHTPHGGSSLPAKYSNPDTTELVVEIARNWNHCEIDLR
jgi:hypothetical protein